MTRPRRPERAIRRRKPLRSSRTLAMLIGRNTINTERTPRIILAHNPLIWLGPGLTKLAAELTNLATEVTILGEPTARLRQIRRPPRLLSRPGQKLKRSW